MKNLLQLSFCLLAFSLVLTSCGDKPAGEKADTGAAKAATAAPADAKAYNINTAASQVLWVGSKPTGKHNGTINLSNGKLDVADGKIVGGKFTLNMNTITVTDLKPGEGKEDLEAHLKGSANEKADHFFNVSKFPTSEFAITKVEAAPAGGDATHNITGNLTIKGKTKSITFPANVSITADKITAVTPSFKINRTDWDVNHMSKSVFDDLKDKFIDDEIALNISLEAS